MVSPTDTISERQNHKRILDLPEKLLPITQHLDDYRYFLLEGGRGGAKSHSIGRFLLCLGDDYNLRIVCGRETQNSINESVYSLLKDLIIDYQLGYEVQSSKINHRLKNTEINFRGFRQQGAFNIQGMEGIDLLWIDEAQAITKQTLDVLIPTIRKDNAKVFFSMNRHVYNDPVYTFLKDRTDCLHIHVNFDDNPFCTTALKREAEECKRVSEKDYKHIWLGEPLDQSEDALYSLSEILHCKTNPHIMADGYGLRIGGFDIARFGTDKCACVVLQQMGALHWEEIFVDEWDHKDLNYTTGRILSIANEYGLDGAIIDEDGLGAGPFDTLSKGRQLDYFKGFRNPSIGYKENTEYGNPRTVNAYKLRKMLMDGHMCLKDQRIIDELMTIRYTFDHNQRRMLISKDKMRQEGVKSPNLADAVIMAVSLIGEVKRRQEVQYRPRMQEYSREESLHQIAGIR